MRNFLFYWTAEQAQAALVKGILPHAASGQLKRVAVGDRVWICGRAEGTEELFLVGYIDVGFRLTEGQAQAEMDLRLPGYLIWGADWHVLPTKGAECRTKKVSMVPVYRTMTFDSKSSQRLFLDGEHPNAQQLQTMRRLTPRGVAVLKELWDSTQ